MGSVERRGNTVRLEMSYEEYFDLKEVLTSNGNNSYRYGKDASTDLIRTLRHNSAEAAWAWANGIGHPPIEDGQSRKFEIGLHKLLGN